MADPADPSGHLPNPRQSSPQQPNQGQKAVLKAEYTETYSGLLPHPALMERWETLLPGTTDRLLVLVEEQEKHRRWMEEEALKSEDRASTRGTVAAWSIMVLGLVCSTFLAMHGRNEAALAAVGAPITGVVIAFLKGNSDRKNERIEKMKIMAGIDRS